MVLGECARVASRRWHRCWPRLATFESRRMIPPAPDEDPGAASDVPVAGWFAGHPIPGLGRLPRERWEEVLRLRRAAELVGMKPTQLARLLTLRGVAQVVAEEAGR